MPPVFSKPAVEQLYSVPFELSYMKETTDYSTIRVSHEFTISTEPVAAGTNSTTHPALPRSQRHVTRKEDLPYVPDSSDKNLLFYAIDAFEEACHADRLKLNTDEKKKNKFVVLIGGDLKIWWDECKASDPNESWDNTIDNLIKKAVGGARAWVYQTQCLTNIRKPYGMTVAQVRTRLTQINQYTKKLTGELYALFYLFSLGSYGPSDSLFYRLARLCSLSVRPLMALWNP